METLTRWALAHKRIVALLSGVGALLVPAFVFASCPSPSDRGRAA